VSARVYFDATTMRVHNDLGGQELPLITGRWVKLQVDIDLDADRQRFFYDGQLLYENSWSSASGQIGKRNIAAITLWADYASPVYYDDLSLSPAPTYSKSVDRAVARSNDPLLYTVVITNPDPLSPYMSGRIADVLPPTQPMPVAPIATLACAAYDSGARLITWTAMSRPMAAV